MYIYRSNTKQGFFIGLSMPSIPKCQIPTKHWQKHNSFPWSFHVCYINNFCPTPCVQLFDLLKLVGGFNPSEQY